MCLERLRLGVRRWVCSILTCWVSTANAVPHLGGNRVSCEARRALVPLAAVVVHLLPRCLLSSCRFACRARTDPASPDDVPTGHVGNPLGSSQTVKAVRRSISEQ